MEAFMLQQSGRQILVLLFWTCSPFLSWFKWRNIGEGVTRVASVESHLAHLSLFSYAENLCGCSIRFQEMTVYPKIPTVQHMAFLALADPWKITTHKQTKYGRTSLFLMAQISVLIFHKRRWPRGIIFVGVSATYIVSLITMPLHVTSALVRNLYEKNEDIHVHMEPKSSAQNYYPWPEICLRGIVPLGWVSGHEWVGFLPLIQGFDKMTPATSSTLHGQQFYKK